MTKKAFTLIFIILIPWLLLVACRPSSVISESDCGKPEVLCVGLVTDLGGIADHSINQLAWEGVLQAQTEKIVDWSKYIETVDAKDYYQNISSLAATGYDIIVTIGEQNSEVTSMAAGNYSEILFIGVDQNYTERRANLTGLVFQNDQTGFLAGALAAQVSKTGTIAGIFGSEQNRTSILYNEGFEAGAKYINPDIKIISTFKPDDSQIATGEAEWGANAAAQAIENGADVVFGAGAKVNSGALLETAKHPGLYCIGVNVDQWEANPLAHSCLLSSAIKFITPGVYDLIELAKDNEFPTGNYFGSSGLAPYHDFDNVISEDVKAKTITIVNELGEGTIIPGYSP